jgi:hypothetical protein
MKQIHWKTILQIMLVIAIVYLLSIGNTEGWGWLVFILFILS